MHTDTHGPIYTRCLCRVCLVAGPNVICVKSPVPGVFFSDECRANVQPHLSAPLGGGVRWVFLTFAFPPFPTDPAPRRRCPHPRREGHRGSEAFPRPLGGLLQAAAGEGGETVWGEVSGKSFLPVCDLSVVWEVLCGSAWLMESAAISSVSSVVFGWRF